MLLVVLLFVFQQEVTPPDGADKHKEKMAEVAVVPKNVMCNPLGKQFKKKNGYDEDLCCRHDGWTPTPQQLDKRLQAKIYTLSKLSFVSSKNEGTYLDSHAIMAVYGKHCYILS